MLSRVWLPDVDSESPCRARPTYLTPEKLGADWQDPCSCRREKRAVEEREEKMGFGKQTKAASMGEKRHRLAVLYSTALLILVTSQCIEASGSESKQIYMIILQKVGGRGGGTENKLNDSYQQHQ